MCVLRLCGLARGHGSRGCVHDGVVVGVLKRWMLGGFDVENILGESGVG